MSSSTHGGLLFRHPIFCTYEDALAIVNLVKGRSARMSVDIEEHAATWQDFCEALLYDPHAILRGGPCVAEEQVEGHRVRQLFANDLRAARSVFEPFELGVVLDVHTNLDDHQDCRDEERAEDAQDEDDRQKLAWRDNFIHLRARMELKIG
jgi:hypothetical protein